MTRLCRADISSFLFTRYTGPWLYNSTLDHPYFIDFILKKPFIQSTAYHIWQNNFLFDKRCYELDIPKYIDVTLNTKTYILRNSAWCLRQGYVHGNFNMSANEVIWVIWYDLGVTHKNISRKQSVLFYGPPSLF